MFFFFNQNTSYELRISDWSSDVCSSDLCWVVVRPPQSPPCAAYFSKPSTFVINWCHRSAVVQKLTPVFVNGVESPNPGMEGTITSNASAGSPPNDAGSASGRITRFRSQKVQGQPCDRMMGMGFGPRPGSQIGSAHV